MIQTSTLTLASYAREALPGIEAALADYLAPRPGSPDRLLEAMRYSLLAPGKRLRPLLALMAAEACGGTIEGAMPAACAVEMVRAYSLIHDDLPAMDDDDLRRGRPTNHKVFGEGLAILAGDALLTMAFEVLARDVQSPAVAAACCATLAGAAGACDLVGGQADDLAAENASRERANAEPLGVVPNRGGPINERLEEERLVGERLVGAGIAAQLEALESIHRRKTGAMFIASLRLGALTAVAANWQLAALDDYGRALGLAFQIKDDLLDVQGDADAVGKRVGKDASRGKMTFPGLLGAGESQRRSEALAADAVLAVTRFGAVGEPLVAAARYVLERDR
jgi:geranylgeranyl diphosphate synthase type II